MRFPIHLKRTGASFRGFSTRIAVIGFALLVAVGFNSCESQTEETPDVIVLHTGRIRGNIYPLELQAIAPLQHYQFIAGYVAKVRKEAAQTGARVLLLDLGDSLDGSFASHATNSANVVEFFNALQYDAILLGNLDNRVPQEVIESIDAKILNPFLGPDGEPTVPGTPVALQISLPGESDSPLLPVYLLANFYGDTPRENFPDRFPSTFGTHQFGVEPARDLDQALAILGERQPEGLTLFCWMKFEAPSQPPKEFLSELRAAKVDAILAQRIYGTNQRDIWSDPGLPGWVPPVSQNILRNNGGFTLARMDLKREGSSWKVLRQDLLPMTANSAPADDNIIALENQFTTAIQEADHSIAELDQPVEEEEILRIFLRNLTRIQDADVVLYSRQSIRSNWPAGELRASTVFNSVPWTGPLVSLSVSPDQLQKLRERNTGWDIWIKDGEEQDLLKIVTSHFFGTILVRQIGLPLEGALQIEAPSEFDFFAQTLQESPEALSPAPPQGWKELTRQRTGE